MIQLPPLDELAVQYGVVRNGRTLLYDGDFDAYAITSKVKTLPTAIRNMQRTIMEQMYLARCERAEVHLTSSRCFKAGRHLLCGVRPYQDKRSMKPKPPLLQSLRMAMADPANWLDGFVGILHTDIEADDGIIQSAYRLGDDGVTSSGDKDLRQTPFPYYDAKTTNVLVLPPGDQFGWTDIGYTEKGSAKLLGHGRKFFWLQMMAGDPVDTIQGLLRFEGQLCGSTRAVAALAPITDEDECANFVIDQYRLINQNPLPEAAALWLLRSHTDHVTQYFRSIAWTTANTAFLAECFFRHWFDEPSEFEYE